MWKLRLFAAVALSLAAFSAGAQTVANPIVPKRAGNLSIAHSYAVQVGEAARRFGIPEAWIWAVIRVESGGNPRAVSRAGAMGLMQLMPATWATLRARLELGNDPFDVRDNILAGAFYLRAMHDRYGNPAAMLAAYNAGPSRYDDYLTRSRPLPAETRAYLTGLAPTIDGAELQAHVDAASSDPSAWRRSAIFPQVGAAATPPGPTQPDRISGTDQVAGLPPANPLFVRPASAVRPR